MDIFFSVAKSNKLVSTCKVFRILPGILNIIGSHYRLYQPITKLRGFHLFFLGVDIFYKNFRQLKLYILNLMVTIKNTLKIVEVTSTKEITWNLRNV